MFPSKDTMPLNSVSPTARVSYEALTKYLIPLEVSADKIQVPNEDSLSVEIRLAELSLMASPKKYLLVFAFSKERKNRLLLLTNAMITEIIEHLSATGIASRESVLIVLGKEGSQAENRIVSIFNSFRISKLLIMDYNGKVALGDFLAGLVTDIDRVETRARSMSDQARLDLTAQPVSEKRIRLRDEVGEAKQQVVFANQILQISGITEKAAMALAGHFKRPIHLMNAISDNHNVLSDFTFVTLKGETKKLNSRIQSSLVKLFDHSANPNDTIR